MMQLSEIISVLIGAPCPKVHGRRKKRPDYMTRTLRRCGADYLAFQAAINRLSNWQRHQWVKAGRPEKRIAEFASLKRRVV